MKQILLAERYIQENKHQIAEDILRDILTTDNQNTRAYELLDYLIDARGEKELAVRYLIKACQTPNVSFSALYSLGSYYLAEQRYQESVDFLTQALKKDKDVFEVLHNLGLAYAGLKMFKSSVQFFRLALIKKPNSFAALNNLGAALRNCGEFNESLKLLDAAIKINNQNADAWLNKGVTLDSLGQFQEAILCYDRALELRPQFIEAICNKANSSMEIGEYDFAYSEYQNALRVAPLDVDVQYNYSRLCLLRGQYEIGWKFYETRWQSVDAPPSLFENIPRLNSLDNLKGKKVLVWSEQGLGDTIQFCRYIPLLEKYGVNITLLVPPVLVSIMATLKGLIKVESNIDGSNSEFDFQIPMMSMPLLFKTDLTSVPNVLPYLFPDQAKTAIWKSRLEKSKRLRVGLVWSGGFRENLPTLWAVNLRRNIPLELIATLQDIPGIDFFSLQKGEPAETEFLTKKDSIWMSNNIFNYVTDLKDFTDTAGLIANLDLIVSVDTSTAHLAAALGKPVWLLNRFDSCWRWLLTKKDTPWYPSMTIYRQSKPGDWKNVIAEVKNDLGQLARVHHQGDFTA
jgi:tetratricopeptide (TPR) repeat protein